MRISILVPFALLFSASALGAPKVENSLQALLDKSCQAGACVDAYSVKFKQISYEAGREQATLFVNLLPNPGITYPIVEERFDAQLTQSSFTAVCRVKGVAKDTFAALSRNEETEGTNVFRQDLRACLYALSLKTDRALGA